MSGTYPIGDPFPPYQVGTPVVHPYWTWIPYTPPPAVEPFRFTFTEPPLRFVVDGEHHAAHERIQFRAVTPPLPYHEALLAADALNRIHPEHRYWVRQEPYHAGVQTATTTKTFGAGMPTDWVRAEDAHGSPSTEGL